MSEVGSNLVSEKCDIRPTKNDDLLKDVKISFDVAGELMDSNSSQGNSVTSTSPESVSSNDEDEATTAAGAAAGDVLATETREMLNEKSHPEPSLSRLKSSSSFSVSSTLVKESLQRTVSKSLEVTNEWTKTTTGLVTALGVTASAASAAGLRYELQLQKELTCPPDVFGQLGGGSDLPLADIHQELTQTSESILKRPIQPSLLVGTRGLLASGAAMHLGRPSRPTPTTTTTTPEHVRFRELVDMKADGARIALDWEISTSIDDNQHNAPKNVSLKDLQDQILKNEKDCIHQPVVLVKHGINNDSNSAYMQSMMRACTDKGWIAVGMNFRGCGGVPLTTPRGYNGTYTGDIRSVVHTISYRLAPGMPLFLIGNSLGANLVTKYLGEEGLSGTLPACVMGGVALGNPLEIHSEDLVASPWKQLLALGIKQHLVEHWKDLFPMIAHAKHYRDTLWRLWWAPTMGQVDRVCAPLTHHNELVHPFAFKVGYDNGEAYWTDSSSYRVVQHVSVPLLQVIASDDMIVYNSFQKRLSHCLLNPNVMCVETKCGGHLGWQEKPPPPPPSNKTSNSKNTPSWAGRASIDFIEAILKKRTTPNKYETATTTMSPDSVHAKAKEIMSFRNSSKKHLTGMPGIDRELFGIRSRL